LPNLKKERTGESAKKLDASRIASKEYLNTIISPNHSSHDYFKTPLKQGISHLNLEGTINEEVVAENITGPSPANRNTASIIRSEKEGEDGGIWTQNRLDYVKSQQ